MGKSKYISHVKPKLDAVRSWCREGLTDEEICKKLGVGKSAFYNYKNRYPELVEVLKEGKAVADAAVEQALYKRAIGYEYEETTRERGPGGKLVLTKEVTRRVAPSTTAQIFWLKNRRPDLWRDVKQIDANVTGKKLEDYFGGKK